MTFTLYNDIHAFYAATYDLLLRNEGQNMIQLGNLIIGHKGKDTFGWRDVRNWFMATVADDGGDTILFALMTPPHNLTLYERDNVPSGNALNYLVEGIIKNNISLPGVLAEAGLASRFAELYAARASMDAKIKVRLRVHELTKVNNDIPLIGAVREARRDDMSFLPYWVEHANEDFGFGPAKIEADPASYHYFIDTGDLYFLEDGGLPVSMARITRPMVTCCSVSIVYTTPYFRGRGYASSCVAQLSRIILSRGFKKCVLYTDLANPISNSIYRKIGYLPVCDCLEIEIIGQK